MKIKDFKMNISKNGVRTIIALTECGRLFENVNDQPDKEADWFDVTDNFPSE